MTPGTRSPAERAALDEMRLAARNTEISGTVGQVLCWHRRWLAAFRRWEAARQRGNSAPQR